MNLINEAGGRDASSPAAKESAIQLLELDLGRSEKQREIGRARPGRNQWEGRSVA